MLDVARSERRVPPRLRGPRRRRPLRHVHLRRQGPRHGLRRRHCEGVGTEEGHLQAHLWPGNYCGERPVHQRCCHHARRAPVGPRPFDRRRRGRLRGRFTFKVEARRRSAPALDASLGQERAPQRRRPARRARGRLGRGGLLGSRRRRLGGSPADMGRHGRRRRRFKDLGFLGHGAAVPRFLRARRGCHCFAVAPVRAAPLLLFRRPLRPALGRAQRRLPARPDGARRRRPRFIGCVFAPSRRPLRRAKRRVYRRRPLRRRRPHGARVRRRRRRVASGLSTSGVNEQILSRYLCQTRYASRRNCQSVSL
mmetsp:Transcript_7944/g.27784  ORF Transcript_7944/g.27784 Transcript_7944/m.27784 type:complete len:309 (+) Transcript_7944:669-1595(+)